MLEKLLSLNLSMKKDRLYQLLLNKMHEVSLVPPQTIGPFTFIYKMIVPVFKVNPLKSFVFISLFFSFLKVSIIF